MRAVQRVHDDARAEPRRPRPQAPFPDHGVVPRPELPRRDRKEAHLGPLLGHDARPRVQRALREAVGRRRQGRIGAVVVIQQIRDVVGRFSQSRDVVALEGVAMSRLQEPERARRLPRRHVDDRRVVGEERQESCCHIHSPFKIHREARARGGRLAVDVGLGVQEDARVVDDGVEVLSRPLHVAVVARRERLSDVIDGSLYRLAVAHV